MLGVSIDIWSGAISGAGAEIAATLDHADTSAPYVVEDFAGLADDGTTLTSPGGSTLEWSGGVATLTVSPTDNASIVGTRKDGAFGLVFIDEGDVYVVPVHGIYYFWLRGDGGSWIMEDASHWIRQE